MRLFGTHSGARISGLAGAAVLSVYYREEPKVKECFATPYPAVTGSRPPDALIFSDKYAYLRQVLNNADWSGVARWYATQIQELAKTTLNPRDYWGLSVLNVQSYCDRTLTVGDLHAFTEECILKMCIADYGNKVGFGFASAARDPKTLSAFFLNGLSHSDGQLNWFSSFDAAKAGSRYGFCLGWVKEPAKHTASRIIVAIGAAFMGAAAWQAISAGSSVATSAVSTTAAGSAGGAAGAAAGAAAVPAIETVVVSASALAPVTAGTVAAGIASGTIAASAAAPAIAAPAAPPIETVVVQAAPVSTVTAGSVASGLATGAVSAVASAPPLVTPQTPIETVTVEASANQPVTAGTVGAGLAAGTIAATAAAPSITTGTIETVTVEAPADTIQIDPLETAVTGVTSIAITQPTISVPEPQLPEIDTEPTLTDQVVEGLENAIADYGAGVVLDQLEQWLTDLLGRPPTPTEIDQWEDWINNGGDPPTVTEDSLISSPGFWILAAVIGYGVYQYSRSPASRSSRRRSTRKR